MKSDRRCTAMVLAAGFGTRLRPLTLELPKPLVWVGDEPALAHITQRLADAGLSDIAINTHHAAEAFTPEMLARVPARLRIVTEPDILGTGGGIANAAPLLDDGDIVVWNGDILAPLDVEALLLVHRDVSPARREARGATLAVTPSPRGEGTVGIGVNGWIVRLRGEVFGEETCGGDFLGVSVIGAELRRKLPVPGCLVGDGLLPWLRAGGLVASHSACWPWDDIGSVDSYLRANARWLRQSRKRFHRGDGAAITGGVELNGSIVGRGALIVGSGALDNCVVWPGATATAPLANAVVTTGGLIAQGTAEGSALPPPRAYER